MSSGALRELFALLEIRVPTDELDKGNKKLDGLVAKLKAAGQVFAEAFAVRAIVRFVESQADAARQLELTSQMLGLTTAELEKFRLAAGETGIGEDTMNIGLRFLNRNLGEAVAKGGEAAKVFGQLHIALKNADGTTRSTTDVFTDIAGAIAATNDPAKKTQIAMDLFGRQGARLIPILNQGRGAIEKVSRDMRELGGPTSQATIEGARKLEASQYRLKFVFERLEQTVATALFPIFTKVVEVATKVTARVLDWTKRTTALQSALALLGVLLGVKIVTSLTSVLRLVGLLQPTAGGTIASMLRFGLVAAAVTALFVVFDDFYAFLSGNKSIIGDAVDDIYGLGAGAETSAAGAVLAKAAWQDFARILGGVGKIAIAIVSGPFKMLWDAAKGIGPLVSDITSGNWGALKNDLAGIGSAISADFGKEGDDLQSAIDQIQAPSALFSDETRKAALGAGDKAKARYVQRHQFDRYGPSRGPGRVVPGKIAFGPPGGSAAASGAGAGLTQTNHYKVDVHTSSDQPKAVGQATASAVSTSQQVANANALHALRRR